MILRVVIETGNEFNIDLKENNIENMNEFGQVIELAPGRLIKCENNTYVRAGSIVIVKVL